jgi:16S rRNA (uracil1498-N3)-methyltransferase
VSDSPDRSATRPTTPAEVDAVAHVFVDSLADHCAIEGTDGHHLQRVLRLVAGERVTAADGTGAWRVYEIESVAKGVVSCVARGPMHHEVEPAVSVAVAVALTKGGIDAVVAGVTELGVARITPVRTARAVVRWDANKAARAIDRLRTIARQAAMQSRRARPPLVEDVAELATLAGRPHVVIADRTGRPSFALAPPAEGEWTLLVGPEGGLAHADLEVLVDRPRLRLGRYVLRAGTAPVAGVAILHDRIAQMRRP